MQPSRCASGLHTPIPFWERMYLSASLWTLMMNPIRSEFVQSFRPRFSESSTSKRNSESEMGQALTVKKRKAINGVLQACDNVDDKRHKSHRAGGPVRKQFTAETRLSIMEDRQPGESFEELAHRYGINKSMLSRWFSNIDSYVRACSANMKKFIKLPIQTMSVSGNVKPCRAKHKEMEKKLCEEINARRSRGRRVSVRFMLYKAKQILVTKSPDKANSFQFSRGWLTNFMRRNNICFRKTTNISNENVITRLPI